MFAVFDKPPHPNAAKLFAKLGLVSPEACVDFASRSCKRHAQDVPAPWVHDYQVPRDGVNYYRFYEYSFVTEQKPTILRRTARFWASKRDRRSARRSAQPG